MQSVNIDPSPNRQERAMNPRMFDGCTFILRAADAQEHHVHPMIFLVTDNLGYAAAAANALIKALDSGIFSDNESLMAYRTAMIEVWGRNEPTPRAILMRYDAADPDGDCENCGDADCPNHSTTTKLKVIPENHAGKPCGLTPDKNINDILLEAFDAMQDVKNRPAKKQGDDQKKQS